MKKKNMKFGGIIVVILILVVISFVIKHKKDKQAIEDPYGVWETMVVLRDQVLSSDPVEDAKGALKRGDVLSVREENHEWSETEYKSYLLVKIEGRKSAIDKLLEPVTAEIDADRDADNNADSDGPQEEVVLARKYKVDMDKVGFDGKQVVNGQPVEDKVFGTDVIIKK